MKKAFIIILLGACGLIITLFAQKNKQHYQLRYQKAVELYNLATPTVHSDSTALALFLQTASASASTNPALAIDCLVKAGNIHQGYQRFSEADNLYHQAIALNKKVAKSPGLDYEAFLYLGSSLYFNNNIDSAKFYFEAASNIAVSFRNKQPLPELDRLYNSLGAIYYESANYLQAKNYFTRALESSPAKASDYQELYTGVKSNIANCLMKLNQFDSALYIFKKLEPNEQQKNIILQNTAHSYFELGHYDSALTIYKTLPLQNNFSSLLALTDMGRIYMKRKQWQQAEIVFDSAIARNKNISRNIKNKEEALAYFYRGMLAESQGLLDEALVWNNEALQEVHLDFAWKKNTDIPQNVFQTVSPITLFRILNAKATLLYKKFLLDNNEQLLAASLAASRKAIETANYIKLNFDNDEAKLFFNDNYRPTYNEAINIAHTAVIKSSKYADDYFFIIENYKGSVLHQNLKNLQLKSTAQVPDSIRRREKEIKQLLAVYTTRINQNTIEKNAGELQQKLLSLQVELSRLQKQYEQDATYNLYKNQVATTQLSINKVQSQLDGNTALFNYYASDSIIYCIVITKGEMQFEKIAVDSGFKNSYTNFIQQVFNYQEGKRYEGFEASASMFNYLVKPFLATAGSCNRWVIIPDGMLNYLPFDALVSNENEKTYLVKSKTISYHYSFALLLENSTHHNSSGKNGILAFAPFISPDESINGINLNALPLSGEELKNINCSMHAGNLANKQRFLQYTTQFPVIHLATHASAGSDSSSNWIQFYPADSNAINNKLFVQEIYNLDMHQAELVILSACETGGGRQAAGEGLLSLSRAFMYAGADGIVSTLWKTEDRVTAFLMQHMHQYLQQQIAPEKALQLAKIDLLNDRSIGSQYKTPNYWANFIYAGKLHPNANNGFVWWWLAAGLLIAGGCYFLYKRWLVNKSRRFINSRRD